MATQADYDKTVSYLCFEFRYKKGIMNFKLMATFSMILLLTNFLIQKRQDNQSSRKEKIENNLLLQINLFPDIYILNSQNLNGVHQQTVKAVYLFKLITS